MDALKVLDENNIGKNFTLLLSNATLNIYSQIEM